MTRVADNRRNNPPHALVELMGDCLFRAAQRETVDLGDERSVHRCLTSDGYRIADVLAFESRALEWARVEMQRRAAIADRLDRAGGAMALVAIAAISTLIHGLLCPPAHAAEAGPLTAVAIAGFAVLWAPFVLVGLLVFCWCWRGPDASHAKAEAAVEIAPPTVPTLATLEQSVRNADGG